MLTHPYDRSDPLPLGRTCYKLDIRAKTVCDKCGKEYQTGDWPFCPHGVYDQVSEFTAVYDEDICEEGAVITHPGQRRAIMKRNKLDYKGKQVGMPGCEI